MWIEVTVKRIVDGLPIKNNETIREELYEYKEHPKNYDCLYEQLIIGTILND